MKRMLKKLIAWLLILMLMSADIAVIAEALGTITLPSTLQIIDEEAFYGNTSIGKIVVPDGTTEIRSKAFAYSTLTEINLPESLIFIADDAFEGCGEIDISVWEGCYAYDRCVELGLIEIIPEAEYETELQDDGTLIIVSCIPGGDIVSIPESIDGVPVTAIAEDGFPFLDSLTEVRIPKTITYIEPVAFVGCSELENIIVAKDNPVYCSIDGVVYSKDGKGLLIYPAGRTGKAIFEEGLTYIGKSAFYYTGITEAVIPVGVTYIDHYAFGECYDLSKVTLPNGLLSIGSDVFNECSSLESIALPDTLTSIGMDAFRFTAINEVYIPAGITTLESGVFTSIESLSKIVVDEKNEYYKSIDGILYDKDGTVLYTCPSGKTGNVQVPEGVTKIERIAFAHCSMDAVELPSTIRAIGSSAFVCCENITEITIPEGVECIDEGTFSRATKLTQVSIPKTVKLIDFEAFYGCSSLEEIVIPEGVEEINDYSFLYCESLKNVTLPSTLTYLGEYVFDEDNSALTVNVPENCYAYDRCVELGLLKTQEPDEPVEPDEPEEQSEMESAHPYADDFDYTWTYDAGEGTESVTITFSEDTETEEEYDFIYIYTLDDVQVGEYSGTELAGQSITINGTGFKLRLTSDESFNYYGFKLVSIVPNLQESPDDDLEDNLGDDFEYSIDGDTVTITGYHGSDTELVIPDGVTCIADYAFYGCSSLTSIVIPDSVTSIDDCAFHGCSSLVSVVIPNSVISIGNFAFGDCDSLETITLPASLIELGTCIFHECSSLTNIFVDEGNEVFSSLDGVLVESEYKIVCYPAGRTSETYEIPVEEGIAYLYGYAFAGCDYLKYITIPGDVYLCSLAFGGCNNLETVILEEGIADIDFGTFTYCYSLTSVVIPDSVTSISAYAFEYCRSLTSLVIPDSVTSIGDCAFKGCSSLTNVVIPDSVTRIDDSAFSDCSNLTIYGVAGSYAEEYANENNITFIANTQPATFSGAVLDENSNGIADVTITAYLGTEAVASTSTNVAGGWTMAGLTEGNTYRITFSKEGYSFTPSEKSVTTVAGDNYIEGVIGTFGEANYLKLTDESYTNLMADPTGGKGYPISVESNVTWTARSNVDWIHPTANLEIGKLLASYDANVGVERVGSIFLDASGCETIEIKVVQPSGDIYAKFVDEEGNTLNNSTLQIDYSGDYSDYIYIISNSEKISAWSSNEDMFSLKYVTQTTNADGTVQCTYQLIASENAYSTTMFGEFRIYSAVNGKINNSSIMYAYMSLEQGANPNVPMAEYACVDYGDGIYDLSNPMTLNVGDHNWQTGWNLHVDTANDLNDTSWYVYTDNEDVADAYKKDGKVYVQALSSGVTSLYISHVYASDYTTVDAAHLHMVCEIQVDVVNETVYRGILMAQPHLGMNDIGPGEMAYSDSNAGDLRIMHDVFSINKLMGKSAQYIEQVNFPSPDEALDFLKSLNGSIDENDVTYIYTASHGYRNDDWSSAEALTYNGPLYHKEFVEALKTIPGTKIVFVQACYSGGVVNEVIAKDDGTITIFSSSGAEETSSASPLPNGNSLFSEAIKAGFVDSKNMDLNGNRQITAQEFFDYVFACLKSEQEPMGTGSNPDMVIFEY